MQFGVGGVCYSFFLLRPVTMNTISHNNGIIA